MNVLTTVFVKITAPEFECSCVALQAYMSSRQLVQLAFCVKSCCQAHFW